jgi:23S rRNA pseudouridine1911/1915/1917 synthase
MPVLSHCIEKDIPAGLRLDRYVAEYLAVLSRSQIKVRALEGRVNGKKVKLSCPVKHGDRLELSWDEPETTELLPENIELDIIYEDDQVIVVNKPQGMVVHPGAGNRHGTLANALYFRQLEKDALFPHSLRPGIVHRLDKDTSGVLIAAYNETAHAFLSDQFKVHSVRKTYIALVNGSIEANKGRIETFIARDPRNRKLFTVSSRGKPAITLYRVIKKWNNYSLVLLRPHTGRTHQLRLHMKYLGHAITGDPLYGLRDSAFPHATLMLHAKKIKITLPDSKDRRIFSAPVPDRIIKMVRILNSKNGG